MILTNFHMHCHFCDGAGDPRLYIEEAIKKDFTSIGFSCHAPIPFEFKHPWTMRQERMPEYIETLQKLKEEYKEKIQLYLGLEIDYFAGDTRDIFNKYPVDYQIGSVHFFADPTKGIPYSVDGSDEDFQLTLKECFHGDIKGFVIGYYNELMDMIRLHKPQILGHLDVIRKNNKNNKYFSEDEPWYIEIINQVLDTLQNSNTIVEVNTGGMSRGYVTTPYPAPFILKECKKRNIPIMLNSDAHVAKNIDAFFEETRSMLKEIGYSEQVAFIDGEFRNIPL